MEYRHEKQFSGEDWYSDSLVYKDLPTKPLPELGKILVTGASGYIGGRLVPQLLERGYSVKVMVRKEASNYPESWRGAEIVVADALIQEELQKALEGIDVAYYLIHSLLLGPSEFEEADNNAAINFRKAAEANNLKRIIYLGGLGDKKSSMSHHLRSRKVVSDELRAGKVPVTSINAAVIIGSGSASYELIHHTILKAPVILIAPWAKNLCQPIGVRDVIKYLVGVLETPETSGKTFDVGGKDVMSYEEMLKTFAAVIQKKCLFIETGFSSIKVFSYFASLLTPVPAQITFSLFEGLQDEVICRNSKISQYLPMEPISYKEAIARALTRQEQDKVHTRWSDSYPRAHELAIKLHEIATPPTFKCTYSIVTDKHPSDVFYSFCRIGGKNGWFNSSILWRIRGLVDKLVMGVGTSRGRRSYANLQVNDVIDFWRVEEIKQDELLLLRAEMKVPGMAWLKFIIDKEGLGSKLTITAYFFTETILGQLYWYSFLPSHYFIFNDLLKQIIAHSRKKHRKE